jgi:hypothetical protein
VSRFLKLADFFEINEMKEDARVHFPSAIESLYTQEALLAGISGVDDSTQYYLAAVYKLDDVRKKAGPTVFPHFERFFRRKGKDILDNSRDLVKTMLDIATEYKNWGVETAPPSKSLPIDESHIASLRGYLANSHRYPSPDYVRILPIDGLRD